ncbi:MAG TPA: hypothetical protein VGF56_10875 [Rhizomicrobium sp.]|jgi:hypothetical protein
MTTDEMQQEEFAKQNRAVANLVQMQASADAMLLTLSIAALMPVVQSIMAFSSAGSRQNHQAVSDSGHSSQAGLATTALAIGSLLNPKHESKPEAPRMPERLNLNVT